MSRTKRVLNGWRNLDPGSSITVGLIALASGACGAAGLAGDPNYYWAAGLGLAWAIEMYLILGVALPNRYAAPSIPRAAVSALDHGRVPSVHDALYHHRSAEYWLRCAEAPNIGTSGTVARATLAQAHAALAASATAIAINVKHRAAS